MGRSGWGRRLLSDWSCWLLYLCNSIPAVYYPRDKLASYIRQDTNIERPDKSQKDI